MCGIGGIFHRHADRPVDPQLLVNMAAIQIHRGLDGFGIAAPEGLGVGFCHARLSIIDLNEQRARQPFRSEDGRVLMAHNGEFYDFQRIRADLTALAASPSRARAPRRSCCSCISCRVLSRACRFCAASSPSRSTTVKRTA